MALYATEFSERKNDLTVWIENFDIFKKRRRFDLDPYNTTYDFNTCDIIVNPTSLMIIGKMHLLGKTKYLRPIVFTGSASTNHGGIPMMARFVTCRATRHRGPNVEIDFNDPAYANQMTLVIKNVDDGLIEKIIQATT